MPSLSWGDLIVIAVDSLTDATGAATRFPIVRDRSGRMLVVRDIGAEEVVPNLLVEDGELSRRIGDRSWLAMPPRQASRGHVVIVRSEAFAKAFEVAGGVEELDFVRLSDSFSAAYVPREAALSWRQECAAAMLAWAHRKLRGRAGGTAERQLLDEVEQVLQQALYVCDKSTRARLDLFCLFGVVLEELEPSRWPPLARVAILQTPGLTREALDRKVTALREELRGRPPDWSLAPAGVDPRQLPAAPPRLWAPRRRPWPSRAPSPAARNP